MALLFKDYIDLVIKDYEEKRDANLLSHLLIDPSTASIRQECLNVYAEKIKNGAQLEENTLRSSFGVLPNGRDFGYVIERHELDKFRPLQKLINGKIKNPTLANVELLAWLIDFTPRPLANAQKILGNINEPINPKIKEGVITDANSVETKATSQEERDKIVNKDEVSARLAKKPESDSQYNRLKIAAIGLIIAILFGGMYMYRQQTKPMQLGLVNLNTDCMYWTGDHYEKTPCNDETKGRLILPLNEEKMKNFKRITKTDTITEKSIGVIYCINIYSDVEYYTTGGNHPVDVTHKLRPLSAYMYNRHLGKKDTSDVNMSAK